MSVMAKVMNLLQPVPAPSVTIYETGQNRFMVVTRSDRFYTKEEIETVNYEEVRQFASECLDNVIADPYFDNYRPFEGSNA